MRVEETCIGAVGALLAVVVTLVAEDYDHMAAILIAIAIGTAFGVPAARRVQMTAMPQLVALFNGVGGGAAAIVALIEVLSGADHLEYRGARGLDLHDSRSVRCRSAAR